MKAEGKGEKEELSKRKEGAKKKLTFLSEILDMSSYVLIYYPYSKSSDNIGYLFYATNT